MTKRAERRERSNKKDGLSRKPLELLSHGQELAAEAYRQGHHLLLTGSPGTGKSFLSLALGMESLDTGKYARLTIVRSIVPVRDIGFLPGSATEKAEAYEQPYRAMFSDLYGRSDAYEILKHKGLVSFMPTSYLRGTTIKDSIVVVDEIQNMSDPELHSVMTRFGDGCHVIFCGDHGQTDLPFRESGFTPFVEVLSRMRSFTTVNFGVHDIIRSGLVKEYLLAKHGQVTDGQRLMNGGNHVAV